jgi:hypothetical protein
MNQELRQDLRESFDELAWRKRCQLEELQLTNEWYLQADLIVSHMLNLPDLPEDTFTWYVGFKTARNVKFICTLLYLFRQYHLIIFLGVKLFSIFQFAGWSGAIEINFNKKCWTADLALNLEPS